MNGWQSNFKCHWCESQYRELLTLSTISRSTLYELAADITSGECSFYHSTASINNVCDIILILLFKFGFLDQKEAATYSEKPERISFWFSLVQSSLLYNNHGIQGGERGAAVGSECKRIYNDQNQYFLDLTTISYDISSFVRVCIPSTYL